MKFLVLFLTAILATSAFAQTTPTATTTQSAPSSEKKKEEEKKTEVAPDPEKTKTLKKIVVTGSYIKKAPEATAPTPVTVMDKSKLQQSASYTVAGALSDDPAFTGTSPNDVFLSLHGQTDADNLVLLNGLRLPKVAGGSAVNIDFIPAEALERTETLKDGASALYGSEALAGVVNIVTRKDFDGTTMSYRLTTPERGGGQETVTSLAHGFNSGRHHFLGVFQFRKDTPVNGLDDKYSRIVNLVDPNGVGDIFLNGNMLGDAGIGTLNCPANQVDADGFCKSDLRPFSNSEDRDYYMTYATYGYDFSDTLKLSTNFAYSRRSWMASGPAAAINFLNESALGRPDFSIPVGIANGWGVKDAGGNTLTYGANPRLFYRATEELGTTISQRNVDNYIAQAELTKSFGEWEAMLAAGYGMTFFRDVTLQGQANKQAVFNLIQTNQFNPFKAPGSKDDIRSAAAQTWFQHTSDIVNPKLIVTGPISKTLSMSFGTETQFQSFKFGYDALTQAGNSLSARNGNQFGSREVYSGFLELDYTPTKQLEIQLAGRFDEYSDFGSTVNPKLGIAYHPIEKLTLRASYGTGFKAPDLLSIYQARNANPTRFRDEVQCKEKGQTDPSCERGVWPVITEGNRNLDPETAQHYNVGFVVTPSKSLLFGADYWRVDGEEGLSAISPQLATLAESRGFSLAQYGIQVTRDPVTRDITRLYIPARVNAGIFKIRGLDLALRKNGQIQSKLFGNLNTSFMFNHTHVLSSEGTSFPIEAFRNLYDLNWDNIMSISFARDNNLLRFQARTSAGGDEDTDEVKGIGKGSTSVITQYDVHYERFLKNDSSLSMGVRNFLGTRPTAEVDGNRFLYAGGYRTFYLGLNKEF